MSRFYASIQGNRGEATRQGTANSGIEGHIRGWRVGIQVYCYEDENGKDICQAFKTGGSRSPSDGELLGEVKEE